MSETYQSKRERRQRMLEVLPVSLRAHVSLRNVEAVTALSPEVQMRLMETIEAGLTFGAADGDDFIFHQLAHHFKDARTERVWGIRPLAKLFIKPKQNASAFAEASSFSRFEDFRPPYLGKTNLAVTKYCVPLRLHRQSNIRMTDGSGRGGFHERFSLKKSSFWAIYDKTT